MRYANGSFHELYHVCNFDMHVYVLPPYREAMHYVTFSASDIGYDPSHDFVMYTRTPI